VASPALDDDLGLAQRDLAVEQLSSSRRRAFERALQALGCTAGRKLRIDYRWLTDIDPVTIRKFAAARHRPVCRDPGDGAIARGGTTPINANDRAETQTARIAAFASSPNGGLIVTVGGRLAKPLFQLRFADRMNALARLRSRRTKTGNGCSALRAFETRSHRRHNNSSPCGRAQS
jgi:hypothetical protein